MPRPRLSIRRIMLAVAILAMLLGAIKWVFEMRTRSARYGLRAFEYSLATYRMGNSVTAKDGGQVSMYDDENTLLEDVWSRRLANKYLRLATYPWLTVEPDPPPPEKLDHPRSAVDLPSDLVERRSGPKPGCPWWTFPWTWRNQCSITQRE